MKLIELMLSAGVRWPVGATHAAQDYDSELKFDAGVPELGESGKVWCRVTPVGDDVFLAKTATDHDTHAVTREEYQAAGGWMLWEGGECPVSGDAIVSLDHANGDSSGGFARDCYWSDVVKYRVEQPEDLVERIAKAANILLPEDATIDTLCDALREQDEAHSKFTDRAIQDHDIVMQVAEAFACEPEDIPAQLEVQHTAAIRDVNRICKALGVGSVIEALEYISCMQSESDLHTIYHDGELYRDSTILLQTDQTLVWRCEGSDFICKPAQALIDPDDNGLAAAILARLSGADVAPEHVAEMREQMGWV